MINKYMIYFLIQIVIIEFFSCPSLISFLKLNKNNFFFNKKFVILFFIIFLLYYY